MVGDPNVQKAVVCTKLSILLKSQATETPADLTLVRRKKNHQ